MSILTLLYCHISPSGEITRIVRTIYMGILGIYVVFVIGSSRAAYELAISGEHVSKDASVFFQTAYKVTVPFADPIFFTDWLLL